MQQLRRIPLSGAYNVRDLGGYAAQEGGMTKWGAFLRADDLCPLTKGDIATLCARGLRTVIDLRSTGERDIAPDPFMNHPEVDYHALPLMVEQVGDISRAFEKMMQSPGKLLTQFYLALLSTQQASIQQVLLTMAQAKPGAILFHCTAGKDRTGVIAALLLTLCGVARMDVVVDYLVSFDYLRHSEATQLALQTHPKEAMESRPEHIEAALDYIAQNHGTTQRYLAAIGVDEAAQAALKERLFEPCNA